MSSPMRSAKYGKWGHPDAWGDTARQKTSRPLPDSTGDTGRDLCPDCRARIWWDVVEGRVERLDMDGRIHLCEPDRVLHVIGGREGETILTRLRRVLNERRVYGETV